MDTKPSFISPADLPAHADVAIVGGGIAGVATAFYASRAGFKTLLLEKKETLASLATGNSAECFRAQWKQPFNINLMCDSIETYKHFAEEVGIPGYSIDLHQAGYLYLTDTSEGARQLERTTKQLLEYGLTDVELLSGSEVRTRFPRISERVVAGRFRQGDGWLSVSGVVDGFCGGSSAAICRGAEVTGIEKDASGIIGITVNGGTRINVKRIVITAGAFSGRVAKLVGVVFPRMMRWVVLNRNLVQVGESESIPSTAPMTVHFDSGAYWRPVIRANRVAGAVAGWNENPKSKESRHIRELASRPMWEFSSENHDLVVARVREGISHMTPFWNDQRIWVRGNVHVSGGQYAYFYHDKNPIICEHPKVKGLFFNTGFAGHGIMMAPAAAKLVVRIMENPQHYSGDKNPFRFGQRPDKYEEPSAL